MAEDAEDREIVEAFAEEAAELLRAAESALNAMLSASPEARAPLWNALLRGLHTVKGSAGFLGEGPLARKIEQRTHSTEDKAKAVSEGRAPFTDAVIDSLAADIEAITAMVHELRTGEAAPASAQSQVEVFAAPATVRDQHDEEARFASLFAGELRPEPGIDGPSPSPAWSAPPAQAPRAAAPPPAPPKAAPPPPAAPAAAAAPASGEAKAKNSAVDEMLRIRPERIDTLQSHFSEVLVGNLQSQALTQDMVEFREQAAGLVSGWRGLQGVLEDLGRHLPSHRRAELRATLRSFGNQLKESYKQSYQLARRSHAVNAESRSALVNLEDGIRALKLMPLEPFLQGFAATVRSAAREVDKKARLEVEARGAEIDRAVLMRLRDPLVHLVRNCIGHGIERPEDRVRAGKDERGVVRLEARLEAQRVFLHVGDDGRGMDAAKVAAKAAAKGLIEPGKVLDEAALLEVICMPGFSTQEQADKISGRGIGMDVVNDTIRSIGGTITLENKPGQGATFILEVPITTSTSQGMVVRLGKAQMGLPYLNVQRVMRVERDKASTVEGRPVVHVQGDPLAVVRLADILGVQGDPEVERQSRRPAVVLRHGTKRMVLEVDEIVGAVEMLIKPLSSSFADHPLILGAAVGADSEILPVLDIPNMFVQVTQGSVQARSRASEAADEAAVAPSRRVLIVDDSVTMRTLERSILEGAGFQVTMAEDGLRGLDALRSNPPFDLVVSDFNMPNMNGLEFCTALRGHGFSTVPVLMVTTMDDDTTRRNVMNAGVDSYLVKRDFNQQSFLRAITELIGAAR
jgi:chemotaxis protein histidine kinase CheA/CheY-like chemotaxis protein